MVSIGIGSPLIVFSQITMIMENLPIVKRGFVPSSFISVVKMSIQNQQKLYTKYPIGTHISHSPAASLVVYHSEALYLYNSSVLHMRRVVCAAVVLTCQKMGVLTHPEDAALVRRDSKILHM